MEEAPQAQPPAEPSDAGSRPAPDRRRAVPAWLAKPLRWVWAVLRAALQFLLLAWATLAVYYSNLPWHGLRLVAAGAVVAFGAWAMWVTRRRRMRWAFAGVFVVVLAWFATIRPSHDRAWRPEVAVLPRAVIDGDRVRLDGVRNFDYRTVDDFTARHESREFSLARVASVDLFVSYWTVGPVAHTFVSFNFDDGTPPLCISIEARPEAGEAYTPVRSMFKQYELTYVVGDERDVVGVRASHRDEDVYLYPIRATPRAARRLLEVYLDRINALAAEPEFYHLLKNSCTINIVRYANAAGRQGESDVRHLLNGWIDGYLYDAGAVDTSHPFAAVRQQARITAAARAAAAAPDFSARIREGVPARPEP